MSGDRLFLDTAYVLARVDGRDQHHQAAVALRQRVRDAAEVWTTEAVLIEIGNGLSASHRDEAVRFIRQCYQTSNIRVEPLDTALLSGALTLYEARADKLWGLTDCISFVVMQRRGLTEALTSDRHFHQAGFRALLLEAH
jgi:uncharacterized protein